MEYSEIRFGVDIWEDSGDRYDSLARYASTIEKLGAQFRGLPRLAQTLCGESDPLLQRTTTMSTVLE